MRRRATPRPPPPRDRPPAGDPGPVAGEATWTPVAELTADDAKAGVVALGTGFRLASLDGTPAADLAARVTAEPPIAFNVAADADGKSARLTPREPLTPGALYRFRLTAPDGRLLDSWAFQAHQPLQVIDTLPRDESSEVPTDTGIEVTFDQDGVVDAESHISIAPKVAGSFERHGRTVAFVPAKRLARVDDLYGHRQAWDRGPRDGRGTRIRPALPLRDAWCRERRAEISVHRGPGRVGHNGPAHVGGLGCDRYRRRSAVEAADDRPDRGQSTAGP